MTGPRLGEKQYPYPQNLLRRLLFMPDGCIEFTGGHDNHGYGQVWDGTATRKAHRVSYELVRGPIPEGLEIDHLCRNRGCVHPGHMEPVTKQENSRRSPYTLAGGNIRKARCSNGHPFNEANTRWVRGTRVCRVCSRQRDVNKRARRKAQRLVDAPVPAQEDDRG